MWRRTMASMERNLQNIRKSPRVADESMFVANNINNNNNNNNGPPPEELPMYRRQRGDRGRWPNGFSAIYTIIIRAPLSILSCFVTHHDHHHVNYGGGGVGGGVDGYWVSAGEFAQISEMNHLMVNDSLRYAILM